MKDQPVKRYIVSRHGMEDADAANEYGQTKLGKHEALMVMADDFSRTDAELRKERTARVEAEAALRIERENNARHKADWTRLYQNDGLRLSELKLERDHLAARVAELESRPEVIAQLEDEKRVLAERVSVLESDLAAVTASSVEHAKTIDGLRAELARANQHLDGYRKWQDSLVGQAMNAGRYKHMHDEMDDSDLLHMIARGRDHWNETLDSARSATHSEGKDTPAYKREGLVATPAGEKGNG